MQALAAAAVGLGLGPSLAASAAALLPSPAVEGELRLALPRELRTRAAGWLPRGVVGTPAAAKLLGKVARQVCLLSPSLTSVVQAVRGAVREPSRAVVR